MMHKVYLRLPVGARLAPEQDPGSVALECPRAAIDELCKWLRLTADSLDGRLSASEMGHLQELVRRQSGQAPTGPSVPWARIADVVELALSKRGWRYQLRHAQEECAEFIAAVSKYMRARADSLAPALDEAADVFLSMMTVRRVLGAEAFDAAAAKKLAAYEQKVATETVVLREDP